MSCYESTFVYMVETWLCSNTHLLMHKAVGLREIDSKYKYCHIRNPGRDSYLPEKKLKQKELEKKSKQ